MEDNVQAGEATGHAVSATEGRVTIHAATKDIEKACIR